jgi:anthranilate/para-aminobenzoate synthase component II
LCRDAFSKYARRAVIVLINQFNSFLYVLHQQLKGQKAANNNNNNNNTTAGQKNKKNVNHPWTASSKSRH